MFGSMRQENLVGIAKFAMDCFGVTEMICI